MARTVTAEDERVNDALEIIMRMCRINDRELGELVDMDRRSIQKRRAGKPKRVVVSSGEQERIATRLGVPLYLFHEPEGVIYQYFAEHPYTGSTQEVRKKRCTSAEEPYAATAVAA